MDEHFSQQLDETSADLCSEACFNSILRDILSIKSQESPSSDVVVAPLRNSDQWIVYKQQAIDVEKKLKEKKKEKHNKLLSKVAEIENRMKENRHRRESLKNTDTCPSYGSTPSTQVQSNKSVTDREPILSQSPIHMINTCTDLLSRTKSLSPSDKLLRSKIQDSVTSLHALADQEQELDTWYSKMADELTLQQMNLQQNFEQMKLNLLTQKRRHIKQSHDYINSLTDDHGVKSTSNTEMNTSVNYKSKSDYAKETTDIRSNSNTLLQTDTIHAQTSHTLKQDSRQDSSSSSNNQETTSTSFLRNCTTSTPTKSRTNTPERLRIGRNPVKGNLDNPHANTQSVGKIVHKLSDPIHTKLGAVIRGHLTRQLFKTGNVQTLVKTYKDSHLFLTEILKENRSTSSEIAQQQLTHHIKEEIVSTRVRLHDMFFNIPLIQQIEMIQHSRELHRKHFQKKQELPSCNDVKDKRLSSVSMKTIKRRQVSNDDVENVCPGSIEKTRRSRRTWNTRVLQPIPGKSSPILKAKDATSSNIASPDQSAQLQNDLESSHTQKANNLSKSNQTNTGIKRGLAAKFDKRVRTPVT